MPPYRNTKIFLLIPFKPKFRVMKRVIQDTEAVIVASDCLQGGRIVPSVKQSVKHVW